MHLFSLSKHLLFKNTDLLDIVLKNKAIIVMNKAHSLPAVHLFPQAFGHSLLATEYKLGYSASHS